VSFNNLTLIEPILAALSKEGYTTPTPIQQQAIPFIFQGRDLIGHAQTGTGKTAAFAIPLLQMLQQQAQNKPAGRSTKALILTPTRELAIQIGESFKSYGQFLALKHEVIFGGVPQFHQVQAIRRGVDIIIATPGRLLDLLAQKIIHLSDIRYFVLDEADRMLDMGFVHDVKRIIAKLPSKKQTLFFSATMPLEIKQLAGMLLSKPVTVEVNPVSSTTVMIEQQVYHLEKIKKFELLVHVLKDEGIKTMLVFVQMKHHADKLAKQLNYAGIAAEAIHGDKLQNARQRALQNFKTNKTRVLVATDIAARGIDIDELTHVLNYDLPNIPETYVHRIGRTGRAGAKGLAISFCDWSEKSFLSDIQKLIKKTIPIVKGHPFDNSLMHGKPFETPANSSNTIRNRSKRNRTFSQA
jgi:ATP-dependent RNA helicase RhlE